MSSEYENPLDEIRGILEKERRQEVDPEITGRLTKNSSISSEKMLANYSSDSPRIYHTTVKDIFGAHIAVNTKLSDGFKKAMPIMVIFGGVMVAALVMGNLPTTIDAIAKNTGVEKRIEVEKVTEVQIVYLTPEEAAAQGISVEETPSGITPDALERGDAPLVNPVPDDISVSPEEAANNQRTEGFDILGNLAPQPIPFTAGNNAENQKTCDTANGYSRHWIESRFVPEDLKSNRSSMWVCLNTAGQESVFNEELILEENIGTYEVR